MQPLGQHFLRSRTVLAKIIQAAELTSDDTILEIGPGKGILTRALAARAGLVVAVEKDRRLVEALEKELREFKNVRVVVADIRDFLTHLNGLISEINPLAGAHQPNIRYKVVANIPYYLTSRLIRLLLEREPEPELIVLMIQREVAERIVAQPPRMNLLALSVQFYGEAEIIARVPAGAFQPPPKVESAIIRIRPQRRDGPYFSQPGRFFRLVHAGFAQKRKTLLNNLAAGLKKTKGEIERLLKTVGIAPDRRAETLTLQDWLTLTRATTV